MRNKKKGAGNLFPNEAAKRMMVEVTKMLYEQAERLLLEGFSQIKARPRDAFDALVQVASLSQAIQLVMTHQIDLLDKAETAHVMLVMGIFSLSLALENAQIEVSADFPFSADQMLNEFRDRMEQGETELEEAVAGAIRRMEPMMTELYRYLAEAYPQQYALFSRLAASDRSTD